MKAVDTPEDLVFLLKMLKELDRQFEISPAGFYVEKETHYSEFERLDLRKGLDRDERKAVVKAHEANESFYAQYHSIEVSWRPYNVDHTTFKHIHKVRLNYTPVTGMLYLEFNYEDANAGAKHDYKEHDTSYNIGFHGLKHHSELKMKIFKLYRKIEKYQEITIPKQQRDKMVQAVCEMFPTIMDDVLFGDDSDETSG